MIISIVNDINSVWPKTIIFKLPALRQCICFTSSPTSDYSQLNGKNNKLILQAHQEGGLIQEGSKQKLQVTR